MFHIFKFQNNFKWPKILNKYFQYYLKFQLNIESNKTPDES